MPRRTFASAAGFAVLFVLAVLGGPAVAGVAHAQTSDSPAGADVDPTSSPSTSATTSPTSSKVPTMGTAAAPVSADGGRATIDTIEPSAINRPLTSSEQRLESLDKWAIGAFVVVSLVVVLVRQRRRRDLPSPEDQADVERDEWDAALEELTAHYRDGADDAAGDR